jgi:hypothetical protein
VLIPVAEQSKAWVCSRSPAGIAGLNSAGGMDLCLNEEAKTSKWVVKASKRRRRTAYNVQMEMW